MDGTYAPQSPDLSSFLSGSSPQKQQQAAVSSSTSVPSQYPNPPSAQSSSYAPRSPNIPSFAQPAYSHPPPQQQHQQQGLGLSYQPPAAPPQQQQSFHNNYSYESNEAVFNINSGYGVSANSYLPPIPDLPPQHSFAVHNNQNPHPHSQPHQLQPQPQHHPHQQQHQQQQYAYQAPQHLHPQHYAPPPQHAPSHFKSESSADAPFDFDNLKSPADMSARVKRERGVAPKIENGAGSVPGLGPSQGIEVKTKFPVARIKRIMQADEEVGKVAQVTPVAVSKALELFMISLVTKSASLARQSNSKRVTAQHLKKAIEADEQFDFLGDIVTKVVEGPEAGGKRVKDEDDSDDSAGGKPVKKARGRKKKGE